MTRFSVFLLLLTSTILFVGCSAVAGSSESDGPDVTWEQAKADAQAMELKIASFVPAAEVASIDQHETGTLFSCDETRHNWAGMTTITLTSSADAEAIVKRVQSDLESNEDFVIDSWINIGEKYRVQLISKTTAEGYILGEGDPGTIVIDSWSECFTLPAGTYPGGTF